MLTELKVSQFAIIDSIHIQFDKGLNILSGETGAGKSILIKSLALLMGAKSSQLDIRSNKDQATIEGAFELDHRTDILERLSGMGIDCSDKHLIVRRIIDKSGKSKVYLNGHLSTVSDLRRVVFPLVTLSNPIDVPLIEITGQHENKDLMSSRYQLDTLDQFCGNLELRQKVEESYNLLKTIAQEKEDLEKLSLQREQQLDFLEFQIKEIEALDLKPNEDESLTSQIKDLRIQENWQRWLSDADQILSGSDDSILTQVKKIINVTPLHSASHEIKEKLLQIYSLVEDTSYQIQKITQIDVESSEDNLDSIEERLSRIRKLQKKFGEDINTILTSCEDMKKEFKKLSELSLTLDELSKK